MTGLKYLTIFIALLGCAPGSFQGTDSTIERAYNAGELRIGMSKAEIMQTIRPAYSYCVKQRITAEGTVELWDFATDLCGTNLTNGYALVFRDDVLVEIRGVQSVYDLTLDNVSRIPEKQ